MVQRVATVAFEGIEARAVDVQVQVAPGLPAFNDDGIIVDNPTLDMSCDLYECNAKGLVLCASQHRRADARRRPAETARRVERIRGS